MKELKISLCLTNYNRSKLIYEAVSSVLFDKRVDEIVISDDCSDDTIYNSMVRHFKEHPKVHIYRNEKNIDCYKNKAKALELAENEWCILFDSDNIIDKYYIDRIENLVETGINNKTAYMPSFAKPHFDFTSLSGVNISKSNIAGLINSDKCQTMLNAMNYFVNRHEWLKCFNPTFDPVTSDSIYQNCRWLMDGNTIYVVPDLHYYHRVNNHGQEEGSHYSSNVRRTPEGLHESILNKLKELR